MKPLDARRLNRDLALDRALRGLALLATLAAIVLLMTQQVRGPIQTLLLMAAIVAPWFLLALLNARVMRALPRLTMFIESDPAAAEAALGSLLRCRGLQRWIRLLLCHRHAALRHRQHRPAQCAAACEAVLAQPRLGRARQVRGHLLLLLAEAQLDLGDPLGAYHALAALSAVPLTLTEALQRLALRTRYELMLGYDAAVLDQVEHKLRLAELMPASQCGMYHAMLSVAAERSGAQRWQSMLRKRVELLCEAQQVQSLRRMLGVG